MVISRRDIVAGLGALAAPPLATPSFAHAQTRLQPTSQETLGPYFPVRAPTSHDFDLTHYPGRASRALGQVIELTGRVLTTTGAPAGRAPITIWQANAAGRYTNPVDNNPAPLDPNFLGVAEIASTADGHYRIRTIKPAPYPEPTGTLRTPHIHFDITHGDYRLATQMYFPGETLNATDILLSTVAARRRDPALSICKPIESREPGVLAFHWDIVLLA
jgi:protocatechuate 3,4-dioxygenase beta subunit